MTHENSLLLLANNIIINENYNCESNIKKLKEEFSKNKYVHLPELFIPSIFKAIRNESELLEKHTIKNHFYTENTGTIRSMNAIGGRELVRKSSLFPMLYTHYELRQLITSIVGFKALSSPNEHEVFGIHYLLNTVNTHGWHLDDCPCILVVMIEAPETGHGGTMECIPNWEDLKETHSLKENKDLELHIEFCRKNNWVKQFYHAPSDAYLLAGNKVMHRVSPMTSESTKRVVFASSYVADPNTQFSERVTGLYSQPSKKYKG
jgi:hypothetical protein